ncbi:MAG: nucleotide sugar dehydrogenase [Myxococcota bacterium]
MARVSVFGLGYVGAVSVACLADHGHEVTGVDVNPDKVDAIAAGRSPIVEAGLDELLAAGLAGGRVRATTDTAAAVRDTDVSFVCVGTPSQPNGSLELSYVQRVCEQIGEVLATKDGFHVVVARSTMLPGSTEEVVVPALESRSGKRNGRDFAVCFNPEFLREGTSIADFHDPPYTVIGSDDERATAAVRELYARVDAPVVTVPIKVAEMVKYACNAFHGLKVSFANEIGNLCKQQSIDSHAVMDLFCRDQKLNLSPYYLKPGFAFGGSCLPKDVRALLYHGRQLDTRTPILESILPSNERQIDIAYQMIRRTAARRIGVLGFSFEAGTDDLRESPMVALIEMLIGKGYDVVVYDRNVSLARLTGANRAFIEQEIPHIGKLMRDGIDEVIDHAELLVIGNKGPEFKEALAGLREDQIVLDLVRVSETPPDHPGYGGICW